MQYFHAVKHRNLGTHGSLQGAVRRTRYLPYAHAAQAASKINFRYAHDRRSYKFTAKEMDEETGLYYYGARYLDAKYSRWLSADPAVNDYIPQAPVNDEAKKHNEQLPGMGGVFNIVNF